MQMYLITPTTNKTDMDYLLVRFHMLRQVPPLWRGLEAYLDGPMGHKAVSAKFSLASTGAYHHVDEPMFAEQK
jgi:hypothetical protein